MIIQVKFDYQWPLKQETSLTFYTQELLFNMGEKISNRIEDLIKTKYPDNAQFKDFILANEKYQKLIQNGLAMKRGFNILTTEEIYNPALNCSHLQSSQQLY